MERKTKHKVLGILVITAFIVIFLPFFREEKQTAYETMSIKAPPFPVPTEQTLNTEDIDSPDVKETSEIVSDDLPVASGEATQQFSAINHSNKKFKNNLDLTSKKTFIMPVSEDEDGLTKIKEHTWVIQLGSFKNKANALRLVNNLRIRGFHAFIQQTSTSYGDVTRVYIGPELLQSQARKLATRIDQDLHIRGIIINYKPLAL